jgi:hypothetical protein
MVYNRDQPMVEVRETEIYESGIDVVRRRDFPQDDEFPAHIPPGQGKEVLRQLAEHVDGYEVVSSDEAELIELARDTLCD